MNGTNSTIIDSYTDRTSGVLADGNMFYILSYSGSCNSNQGKGKYANNCAHIDVDINGKEGPSVVGKDLFSLYITKQGLVTSGGPQDKNAPLATTCIGVQG